jgi:ribosomal protein S18 acetylase RimI-like enzyme
MGEILQDMLAPVLIAAAEANLAEEMAAFGRYLPGAELHEDPEMQWIISPLFNAVVRTCIVPGDIDARIDETLAYFRSRHASSIGWSVSPSTRPSNLAAYLLAHGLTLVEDQSIMAANLQTLHEDMVTPPNLRIEEVSDQEMLKQYARVSMQGFGSSADQIKCYYDTYSAAGFGKRRPWHHYLGRLNQEPVAVSSLLLYAGVVGVYGVATIPTARRQGMGAAMTLAALREARRLGYRVGILTPSEMGLGIYRRLGFREYYTTSIYARSLL